MKEGILWIGYHRPEYTKVSVESIISAYNAPVDFYAYVDNDGTHRSRGVIAVLESFRIKNICFRSTNFGVTPHILRSLQDFFSKGYDVCHFFQDDIIVSRDYFDRANRSLLQENIFMFCGCVAAEEQRNRIYPYLSVWGSSFKKTMYDYFEPHIEPFLKIWNKENGMTTLQYQLEQFGKGDVNEFDGLFDNIVRVNNLMCEYPERSYSKDIGEYGFQRKKGIPPIKTLEEWADTPPVDIFGYGINGIDFKL